jgi:hypothetical protein
MTHERFHTTGEHPRSELELHADAVRSRLLSAVAILERRGRDALDVKLQLQRHAVAVGALAGLLVLAAFGGAAVAILRARERARERARRPRWRALKRAWKHPERVAPENRPSDAEVVRKIALAIALPIVSPLAKRYTRRVLGRVLA